MRLTVNGVEHDVLSPPLTTLLDVLREELFITSPKAGCQQGGCGACTVLVDGEPRRSCLTPVAALEGASVLTVEGLGTGDDLSPVQAAFHEHYAAQCGFCTSGFLTTVTAFLDDEPDPTEEQAREAISGNLCRCTGYQNIVKSVLRAAELRRERAEEAAP